jgi:fumarylpyruvate hydrolase
MSQALFEIPANPVIAVRGEGPGYPVGRIFCVGRNYAAHAAEMGNVVDREAPFYFTKSPAAVAPSGSTIPYPPGTSDFHHEVELVLGIASPAFRATSGEAKAAIGFYGCGLDMTRRDLQAEAKAKQRPWDTGKDFENSAILAPLTRAGDFGEPGERRIFLKVNGALRQEGRLSDMVWSPVEIVRHLSTLYHLRPGDLIMTGTPAGVGALQPGDSLSGGVDGLDDVTVTIGPAA